MNAVASPRLGARDLTVAVIVIAVVVALAPGADAALFRPATAGVAFIAGLVSGSHCIGMCGGFVLCYAARSERGPRAHVVYAIAKTVSYTTLGAICGALGQALSLGGRGPGITALIAGVFLFALGVHMLGWPALPARFRLTALDRAAGWIRERARRSASPLGLGLANGLMLGCGPLLAMYGAAAGTGSAREGALLLAAFGLGTLPVMLASAWIASTLARNFQRQLTRLTGPVVLICGLMMAQRGWALVSPAPLAGAQTGSTMAPQIIRMAATADGWSPDRFVVQKSVPVKWIIDGRQASACTARLRVPALGREVELTGAETVVEFTPTATGEMPWTCWMGMASGRFVITEAAAASANVAADLRGEKR